MIRNSVGQKMKSKIVKRSLLFLIALVILFSTAKSLDLQKKNNIVEQQERNQVSEKDESMHQEKQSGVLTENDTEADTYAEISSQHEGLPVLLQNDQIQNDYYGYTINGISISKELGDFQNPYEILEHVNQQGDTEGPYSYLILKLTIECYQEIPELYLNTLKVFLYKGVELARGYEALTSNNTVPMSGKSGMKCVMKKGEEKSVNIVYLVDDEYVEDTDIYLYINNRGASSGDDIENKRLVKLDTEAAFQ